MKKTLSLLLVLAMVLTSFTAVFAADETEKTPGEILEQIGVLKGNTEGDLMLDKEVSRRDMVVLLSRLLGQEDEAKNFSGDTTFKDVKDTTDPDYDSYYVPYIAWAQANKLTNGVDESGEVFSPKRSQTEQEILAYLLRALGYGFDEVKWEDTVAKAAELKLIDDAKADYSKAATREVLAKLSLQALKTKVKDSDKTLAEKLELTLPEAAKLEVKEVKADNLKEIKVVFNKSVDKDVAEDKDLYTVSGVEFKDAKVEDDNTVVLTVADDKKDEDNSKLTNKKEYTLTIRGYKDAGSEVNNDFKFTAHDNNVPEVVEVVGLGTKAVKVVMSEPIKSVKSSSFTIDGKTYYGSVSTIGREIILKPYGSTFSIGDHKLVVKSLEDYAGFKSVETENSFTVVEDKDAPTVTEVKGTLERIVVTFSEDVDDSSVSRDSLYWGGTKTNKAEEVVRLSGNRYAFEFSREKALPTYEVTLTIKDVKDYSGNTISSTEIPFKAEVDQTRPEVIDVDIDDGTVITVKFNKGMYEEDAVKKANYTLTDEDGKKVSIKDIKLLTNQREVEITLYNALKENKDYTLKISGIRDNTKLMNTMLPYEQSITAGNYNNPKIEDPIVGNNEDRTIFIPFNKKMNVESISNLANYLIVVKDSSGNSTQYLLSELDDTDIDVRQDGKSVLITLPEKINKEKVGTTLKFGKLERIPSIVVLGVKDTADNILKGYGTAIDITTDLFKDSTVTAKATDSRTIEVKFARAIANAYASDFNSSISIDKVEISGSTVTLTLSKDLRSDLYGYSLSIDDDNDIESVSGEDFDITTDLALTVKDEISPSLDSAKANLEDGKLVIKAIFDEALSEDSELQGHAKDDLKISKNGKDEIDLKSAVSEISGDTVIVRISDADAIEDGASYSVEVVKSGIIRDKAENYANTTDDDPVYTNPLNKGEDEKVPAKAALKVALDNAKKLFDAAKAGTKVGNYPQDAIDTFKTAIDNAQKVYDNSVSTVDQLTKAKTDLEAAQVTFENAKVKPVATTVELTLTPVTVIKPGAATADAVVKDQDGNVMTGVNVVYAVKDGPVNGVSIAANSNIVVVDSTASAGTVTITATADGVTLPDEAVLTIQ